MPGNGAVGASYGELLTTSLIVLVGVCVVGFVIVRVAARVMLAGRSRGGELLGVVARLALEPRRSLYVVEVAGKTLLVGTSEMGLSVLSELDGAAVQARTAARPSFGELVRAAWTRRRLASEPAAEPGAAPRADAMARDPAPPGPQAGPGATAGSPAPGPGAPAPGDPAP